MKRTALAIVSAVGMVLAAANGMSQASASPARTSPGPAAPGTHIHILGTAKGVPVGAAGLADTRAGTPPLLYHSGGAIAKAMKIYTIFWDPGFLQDGTPVTMPTAYKNTVNQFMHDYSGFGIAKNNTQYCGYSGVKPNVCIGKTTSYHGSFTVTTPFPVGSCSTSTDGNNCVSDADLGNLARSTAAAHAIAGGTGTEFFVYTPNGEGSCFSTGACADNSAAYTRYCAYHTYTNSAYGPYPQLVYANQPWPSSPLMDCSGGSGQTYPNLAATGDLNADASINVSSHELSESITDPLINAWYDTAGYEIGDECAWQFGILANGSGDVRWNNHPYSIQMEGSNHSSNCVIAGP